MTRAAPALRLRSYRHADVPLVMSAATDPYIVATTTVPAQPTRADADAYVDRQRRRADDGVGHAFVVARAVDDVAVGHVFLSLREIDTGRASVGYWVGPDHRGQGVAREALRLLVLWSDETLAVPRLWCAVEPQNHASLRVAEHNGFEREGLMRGWAEVEGVRRDFWQLGRVGPR